MTQTCASVYKISPVGIYIPVRKREEIKICLPPNLVSCLMMNRILLYLWGSEHNQTDSI